METINYLKLQAKNLHKDFKTQKPYFDLSLNDNFFDYTPKFFDVNAILNDFVINENRFTLMNAQHIIAKMVGYEKWTEMINSSIHELELAKLLFDNMHKIRHEEWKFYIFEIEQENDIILDDEDKLDIFKTVFADVDGHENDGYDYRLSKAEKSSIEKRNKTPKKMKSKIEITSLPLTKADRDEFIKVANKKFKITLDSIEHSHPELVRNLWNPEQYIDETIKPEMLPIDRDYAISLVDAFLIHKVLELANHVDMQD